MNRRRHALGWVAFGLATGCGTLGPSRAPVDLRDVDVRSARISLRGPRNAVCPGEPTAFDVDIEGMVAGRSARLVQVRHDIDDAIFDLRQLRMTSPQGSIDDEGVFHPNADVRASVHSGFVVYARFPNGPAFSVRYPPSYECTSRIGGEGRQGGSGVDGGDALYTDTDGPILGRTLRRDAASGRPGETGAAGSPGPRFEVFVTWVRTPDYTKLLAARAFGDVDALTLVAPGTPLDVIARGGRGGLGGRGGQGATATLADVAGGRGGPGGRGGDGGPGGAVTVHVDDRYFEEIARWVTMDVGGGGGGEGGPGGIGGGTPGAQLHENKRRTETLGIRSGDPGAPGPGGKAGPGGMAKLVRGEVRDRFDGLGAIVPY